MRLRPPPSLALGAVASLLLTGCGSSSGSSADADAGASGGGAAISVVASTDVYGDIASVVGGDRVEVTSIIDSATQDPHEYEASAQDLVAVDRADLVLENGGGYDPFVDTMLESTGTDAPVITAVDVSGLAPADDSEGFNEHVWYSYAAVDAVARDLSSQLGDLDPDGASTYEANYAALADQLDGLDDDVTAVAADADGRGVAITEPVPLYLLDALGLVNTTPEEFSEAVEEGADVPARVLQETLDTLADGDVALLAYNAQTADDTTERVRRAAEDDGVPVVDFTETLPDGMSYVEWQQANVDAVAAALQQS